jgi:hypothetical protein
MRRAGLARRIALLSFRPVHPDTRRRPGRGEAEIRNPSSRNPGAYIPPSVPTRGRLVIPAKRAAWIPAFAGMTGSVWEDEAGQPRRIAQKSPAPSDQDSAGPGIETKRPNYASIASSSEMKPSSTERPFCQKDGSVASRPNGASSSEWCLVPPAFSSAKYFSWKPLSDWR